jgi:hypothetical protein
VRESYRRAHGVRMLGNAHSVRWSPPPPPSIKQAAFLYRACRRISSAGERVSSWAPSAKWTHKGEVAPVRLLGLHLQLPSATLFTVFSPTLSVLLYPFLLLLSCFMIPFFIYIFPLIELLSSFTPTFRYFNFSLLSLFWKYRVDLWNHIAVCLYVYPPINFWTPKPIFMKLGTYITPPEPTSTA